MLTNSGLVTVGVESYFANWCRPIMPQTTFEGISSQSSAGFAYQWSKLLLFICCPVWMQGCNECIGFSLASNNGWATLKIPGGLTSVECIHLQHKYVLVASSDCSRNSQHAHIVEQLSSTFTPPSRLLFLLLSLSLSLFPASLPLPLLPIDWCSGWLRGKFLCHR